MTNRFTVLPKTSKGVVQTPSFITGEFAEAVFADYQARKAEQFPENPFFKLQLQDGVLVGSTLQDVALLDGILRENYGARVLVPSDLHNDMRIPGMIKDKHYVDRFALVLRGPNAKLYDKRAKNIAESLELQVDVKRLEEEPALVTGLKVVPANGGFGFAFAPAKDGLKVAYSKTFLPAFNEKRFNGFDENGIAAEFAEDGQFTNYTNDARVARFGLYRYWDSLSDWYGFGYSDADGRVVVADAVGTRKR